MAAVCQQLLREYEVDPVQLELDLQQLMTQLSEAGLVKIGWACRASCTDIAEHRALELDALSNSACVRVCRKQSCCPPDLRRCSTLVVAETCCQMIVDHAPCLHVGVDDGRADEGKAAFLQVL